MNKTSALYKREQCYFIRSENTNYLFKKRFFGKIIKIEVPHDAYIKKPFIFRFLKIFTDEALQTKMRRIYLVVKHEHGKDIAKFIEKAGLIDYNAMLEERKRKKNEEMALKMQQMKTQATENITAVGDKVKGLLGGFGNRK